MFRILVVENDNYTIQSIKYALSREDFIITFTSDAEEAIEIAWKDKVTLIVAGMILPKLTGLEVLGILKKNELTDSIPFVVLSNESKPEDEIKAFNLGADDYIVKPFNSEVFRARIKAILRRSMLMTKVEKEEILTSGNIIINLTSRNVYIKEKPVYLTPKEFALLYLFMKKKNRVLSRETLSSTIWEYEYAETSRTLDKHISNLRKKMGEEGKRIVTLPAVGYKLIE